jgi:hypothetical protein
MSHAQLFVFESDFVATLRCIPMAVRFKLDRCLVKLSLRQWSRFTPADRERLLITPCETTDEVEAYQTMVCELVTLRAGGEVKMLDEPPQPLWRQSAQVPQVICAFAESISVRAPSTADWEGLSPLQRFVLLKLSRDNHDNVNFVPALREFGLADRSERPSAAPVTQIGGTRP